MNKLSQTADISTQHSLPASNKADRQAQMPGESLIKEQCQANPSHKATPRTVHTRNAQYAVEYTQDNAARPPLLAYLLQLIGL